MGKLVIATSVAVLMSTTAFATDCKYIQKIVLDDNNVILSAKTEYVCRESKPIIVLPPITTIVKNNLRPYRPVLTHSQITNIALGN